MTIEITKLRHFKKGHLCGFVDIVIKPLGIAIHNITWFSKDGNSWFNLPSEKYTNDAGETKYRAYVSFPDDAVYKGFQAAMDKEVTAHAKANPEQAPQNIQQPQDFLPSQTGIAYPDGVPF